MNAEAQAWFQALRTAHYPAHRNQIAAHLTLFHALPETPEIRQHLRTAAAAGSGLRLTHAKLYLLGGGVAYRLESEALQKLHAGLVQAFGPHLTPQDRQPFRPHVVIQNKVAGREARTLFDELQRMPVPTAIEAVGLEWWRYLGGPWEAFDFFPFF